jgi:hypothetical protein
MKLNYVIILGIIILLITGYVVVMNAPIEESSQPDTTFTISDSSSSQDATQKFSRIGHIVKPEGEDDWYLVYEEPGKPALRVRLVFPNSKDTEQFSIGDRVSVEGIQDDDVVVISSIKKIQ